MCYILYPWYLGYGVRRTSHWRSTELQTELPFTIDRRASTLCVCEANDNASHAAEVMPFYNGLCCTLHALHRLTPKFGEM